MLSGRLAPRFLCAMTALFAIQSTVQAQDWITDEDIYRPYVEATAQGGSDVETIQGLVFIPIWGSEEDLFYADLRGTWSDQQTAEGNWGLGFRHMIDHNLIVGGYGFYDLRHTQSNNNFQQVTLGLELLTIDWDLRVNGYIPETDSKAAAGANQASVSNGTIVVNQGFEKAYYGTDFEAGYLFGEWNGGDTELRGYAGGYFFDRSAAGYQQLAGPRVRAEMRIHDLDFLGSGSRLVAGAQYQYDELRGSQPSGILQVRIPFGAGGSRKLTRIQRRMLNPIVRDIDVITNAQATGPSEETSIVLNGQRIRHITTIDADTVDVIQTIDDAPGGPGKIIVFDGSKGDILVDETIVIKNGKFAGGVFQVEGLNSGAIATFGNRANIVGTDSDENVFNIRNRSIITGLSISGGQNGIVANDRGDFMIVDNQISDTRRSGINLRNSTSGMIWDNTVTGSGNDGFMFDNFYGGVVSGNTSTGSDGNGFKIEELTDTLFTRNTASENTDDGFDFGQVNNNVTISNNLAMNNEDDGFDFERIGERRRRRGRIDDRQLSEPEPEPVTPIVTENRSIDNEEDGFAIEVLAKGTFTNNIASGNGIDGFYIERVGRRNGGLDGPPSIFDIDEQELDLESPDFRVTMTGNQGLNNGQDGFYIESFSDTLFSNNTGNGNMYDGIHIINMSGGEVRNNNANNNAEDGFIFEEISSGIIDGNRASDNGDDGFDFGVVGVPELGDFPIGDIPFGAKGFGFPIGPFKPENFNTQITNNRSANNAENGFQIDGMLATDFSGNGSVGNAESGYDIGGMIASQFSGNAARDNGYDGFYIDFTGGGCIVDNVATDNAEAGYNVSADFFTEATGNTGSGNGSDDTFELEMLPPFPPFGS